MLNVSVFVVLVVMVCDVIGDDFTCFPNQTIRFTNPDSSTFTNYRAFYSDGGSIVNCTQNTNDAGLTVIFTCGSTSNNITAYFSDRSLSDDDIIGGAGVKYTFQCAPLSDHNVTLLGNLTAVSVNHTVESSDPFYDITANIYSVVGPVTTATVGELLVFIIAVPNEYTIKPLLCVAKGGSNTKTLITDGCSDDDTLVSHFVIGQSDHETGYIMPFTAFKFFDTDALDIECTVKVCITSGCNFATGPYKYMLNDYKNSSWSPKAILRFLQTILIQTCPDERRRRAFSGNDADDDSAEIASFSKRLIIKDVVLGGSTRANGSLGLTLALSMLCALMKA